MIAIAGGDAGRRTPRISHNGRRLESPPTVLCFLAILAACLCQPAALCAADDDADAQEQAAFRAAVSRVTPTVVQIETLGGREKIDGVLFGAGPTTGLVVDRNGYIISSAFNFASKPTSILVRLPNGDRKRAKLVATDRSRMLVLLKIEVDKPLPECEVAPRREMRVGQWAIAVGRTFETDRPNMAVGLLSAVDRIWGKAIQTDAAVSPNNYGGPLVDIRGRVLGVLVPLSPDATGQVAGMEWYDSGIGFAIPMEHVMQVLPRLKKGEDLHPGVVGVSLKGPNPVTSEPIITACRPKSPATAAGMKAGDRIVDIDGRAITRASDVKEEIGRRYAGDRMRFTVLRDKESLQRDLELVAKLEPFQHAFLGILPMRTAKKGGVTVRYVYPKSPAAAAGIAAGDVMVSLDGKPVQGRLDLIANIGALEPGSVVEIETRRDDAVQKLKIALARLPEDLPAKELPPAAAARKSDQSARTGVGATQLKIPEYANEVWAYVPEDQVPGSQLGVVVWLHGRSGFDWKKLATLWKPLCDRYGLILVAPKSSDPARWTPGDVALIDRLLAEITSKYNVDPARIVVHGHEDGGALAFLSASLSREVVRAVAAVEAAPMGPMPENDPLHRMAIYAAASSKSPSAGPIKAALKAMREMKIPVVEKKLGETPRYLNAAELAELARWIDTLDRM